MKARVFRVTSFPRHYALSYTFVNFIPLCYFILHGLFLIFDTLLLKFGAKYFELETK